MNIQYFKDIQDFGLNKVTVCFIGTVLFSIIQGWGLWEQRKTIIKSDSSKSIAVMSYAYFSAHYIAFSIYGIREGFLSMIINGLLGFLFLANYISIIKTKDHGAWKKWQFLFVILIPLMCYTPHPEKLLGLMLIFACALGTQAPYEIYMKGNSGSVELKFVGALTVSICFWTGLSFFTKEWPLFVSCVYSLGVMLATLFLYKRYHPSTKARLLEELITLEESLDDHEGICSNLVEELSEIGGISPDLVGGEIGLCRTPHQYATYRIKKLRRRLNLP